MASAVLPSRGTSVLYNSAAGQDVPTDVIVVRLLWGKHHFLTDLRPLPQERTHTVPYGTINQVRTIAGKVIGPRG